MTPLPDDADWIPHYEKMVIRKAWQWIHRASNCVPDWRIGEEGAPLLLVLYPFNSGSPKEPSRTMCLGLGATLYTTIVVPYLHKSTRKNK